MSVNEPLPAWSQLGDEWQKFVAEVSLSVPVATPSPSISADRRFGRDHLFWKGNPQTSFAL